MIEVHYVAIKAYCVLYSAENCEDTGFQVWTCIGVGNFTAGNTRWKAECLIYMRLRTILLRDYFLFLLEWRICSWLPCWPSRKTARSSERNSKPTKGTQWLQWCKLYFPLFWCTFYPLLIILELQELIRREDFLVRELLFVPLKFWCI